MACKKSKQGKKRYCIGDFRHSIKIISGSMVSTEGDYDVDNNNTILTTRAVIKTSSGIPYFAGTSMGTSPTHTFIIRYTTIPIEKNYIIECKGNYYHIESIRNDNEDDLYIIINASKRGVATNEANWK